jgi:hypothetical protein
MWSDEHSIPLPLAIVLLGAPPAAIASILKLKILPMTVPLERKPTIVAKGALNINAERVVGPLIASVLVVIVGPAGAFL